MGQQTLEERGVIAGGATGRRIVGFGDQNRALLGFVYALEEIRGADPIGMEGSPYGPELLRDFLHRYGKVATVPELRHQEAAGHGLEVKPGLHAEQRRVTALLSGEMRVNRSMTGSSGVLKVEDASGETSSGIGSHQCVAFSPAKNARQHRCRHSVLFPADRHADKSDSRSIRPRAKERWREGWHENRGLPASGHLWAERLAHAPRDLCVPGRESLNRHRTVKARRSPSIV